MTIKMTVIASLNHAESQAIMYSNNGVLASTVRGWLKDKDMLHESVDTVSSTDGVKRNCQRATA